MRYEKINPQLFIDNRNNFKSHMEAGSLAVFNANDVMPTNADGTMKFVQNKDFFYLSGVDQEEAILVIFPDAFHAKHREMLFVTETNEHIARWEGAKLDKEEATAVSGIENVYWLQDFDKIFQEVMSEAENVYLNTNEHLRKSHEVETRDDRFRKDCMAKFPLHNYKRAQPIMHALRGVKSKIEVDQLQKACDINTKAFNRILKVMKPGMREYELEAEFIHEYVRHGSPGFSYEPIIASGKNATVLHYLENKDDLKDGELVLFDCGCFYANYASDVTRCYPANGRFSDRQKELYNAVLRVQKKSLDLLRPGNQLHEYHKQVGDLMTDELLQLGLLDKTDVKNQDPNWPAYKKYFIYLRAWPLPARRRHRHPH